MSTDINIVYHLGAPNTDNEQVTWSLRKDANLLTDMGIMIRRPKGYRAALAKMIGELDGDRPSAADQEELMSSIIRGGDVKRLIMSNSNFMGIPSWMFYSGHFYVNAAKNTATIRNLFPDNPCEFFLGIVNPATFIPSVFKSQTEKTYEQFMENIDLAQVRWSDVIERIQAANPDCPITIWANEDTPIIWPTVLREIAGLEPDTRLSGELDIIREIISEEGTELLEDYLEKRPQLPDEQRRKILGMFLEKYYLEDAVDETIDLPGWTEETVDALTEIYEHDLDEIQQLPNVKVIAL